ncbi:unnamed protein product [Rotaria sp. Silwood1]|nr:unnamed protein product [Rotaria sp. Silwood1]
MLSNEEEKDHQIQQMNDAIKALGIDPSSLDPQQKKTKKYKKTLMKNNIHLSNSATTTLPLPLSFNSDSCDLAEDSPIWLNEQYIKDHHLEEEVLEDDINMTMEQRDNSTLQSEKKTNDDGLLQTDLILEKITNVLNKFEEKIQHKIDYLESKFDRRFDQLSQKVDNLYERGTASSILFHLNTHHYLDAPLSPTSQLFDSHFSKKTRLLFGFFAQEMHKRYSHLWTNNYKQMGVSLRPEQIEVDLLGFAYEKTNQKKPIFNSPNMESLQANSSYSFIKPFKANTIIIGEVTTSIIDFNHQDLVHLEQSNSKLFNVNLPTYILCQKLMQLERTLNFILIYFNGAKLENLLVALVGRFDHRRSSQQIYKLLFQSTFSNKIPLLNQLSQLEHEQKSKQLYFIS